MLTKSTFPVLPASPLRSWLGDVTGWLARRWELDKIHRASVEQLSSWSDRELRDIDLDRMSLPARDTPGGRL